MHCAAPPGYRHPPAYRDGLKELLIAPLWTGAKRTVLNRLQQYLKEEDILQGQDYSG